MALLTCHDLTAAVREASHILHEGRQVFFGRATVYPESELAKRFLPRGGEPV